MLILRIKRCEWALSAGRLDEAADLLGQADLRAHRRGQELTTRLVAALVERGRAHLAAGRLAAAGEDCRRASALAGNVADIAQLRGAIDAAATGERERLGKQQHAAAEARRLVQQGHLTMAGQHAARAQAAGDAGAEMLLADVDGRRATFDRSLADASAALARDDWQTAIVHLARARALRPGAAELHAMAGRIGQRVAGEAQRLVDAGQLDAAGLLLRRGNSLCESDCELERIGRGLESCRRAWQCVRDGRHGEAREKLARLAHMWPRATWLGAAIEGLAQAGQAMEAVRSGPIGLLHADETMPMTTPVMTPTTRRDIAAAPRHAVAEAPASEIARRFVLHVDGAGSYLVLTGDSIRVGPVSASSPPDLPLVTAATTPTIVLSRSDEDYFLSARSPVAVNDRPVTSKLLASGDRIAFGPRCRMEFRRPNPASASAALQLSGARLPWGGVREVLLMGRELVIGPDPTAHVRTRDSAVQVVLHASEGRLLCRAGQTIVMNQQEAGRVAAIASGGAWSWVA